MILTLLATTVLCASTYDFVATETARVYVFPCDDSLYMRYVPIKSVDLVIRSSKKIHCSATALTSGPPAVPQLPLKKVSDNLFEGTIRGIPDDNGAYNLTFQCDDASDDTVTISPISQQRVLSRGGLLALGLVAILMLVAVMGIIGIQFLTFHRKRKQD